MNVLSGPCKRCLRPPDCPNPNKDVGGCLRAARKGGRECLSCRGLGRDLPAEESIEATETAKATGKPCPKYLVKLNDWEHTHYTLKERKRFTRRAFATMESSCGTRRLKNYLWEPSLYKQMFNDPLPKSLAKINHLGKTVRGVLKEPWVRTDKGQLTGQEAGAIEVYEKSAKSVSLEVDIDKSHGTGGALAPFQDAEAAVRASSQVKRKKDGTLTFTPPNGKKRKKKG